MYCNGIVGHFCHYTSYCVADDNKLYYGRFIGRGLAPVWYLIILTIVLNGFYKGFLWVDRLISRNVVTGKQIFNLFFNGSAVSLLLYLIILTSNSFYANGYWNTKHFSRYIPTSLWETYIWVEKNIAPNAEVLALNWRDIYLLPIYTDVNLIYGSWIIDNRSALFEVERYLAGQKLLGQPKFRIQQLAAQSVESYRKLIFQAMSKTGGPYVSHSEAESAMIASGLIYFPHIKNFEHVPLMIDGESDKTNPEFVKHVLSIYESIDEIELVRKAKVEYIILAEEYWKNATKLVKLGFMDQVHETQSRRIYQINFAHGAQSNAP